LNFYPFLETGYNHLYSDEDKRSINARGAATVGICAVRTTPQYKAFWRCGGWDGGRRAFSMS